MASARTRVAVGSGSENENKLVVAFEEDDADGGLLKRMSLDNDKSNNVHPGLISRSLSLWGPGSTRGLARKLSNTSKKMASIRSLPEEGTAEEVKMDLPVLMPLDHAKLIFDRESRRLGLCTERSFRKSSYQLDVDSLNETSNTTRSAGVDKDECLDDIAEEFGGEGEHLPSDTKKPKSISFSKVEIREHPIIVGDHPGGTRGVPLTIDWATVSHISLDLDQYEVARSQHRRKMKQMRMAADRREKLLQGLGYTRKDMLWGIKRANIARNLRRKTNELIHMDRFHERLEKLGRKARNVLTLGGYKRKEQEYLKAAMLISGTGAFKYYVDRSTCSTTTISTVQSAGSVRSILSVRSPSPTTASTSIAVVKAS